MRHFFVTFAVLLSSECFRAKQIFSSGAPFLPRQFSKFVLASKLSKHGKVHKIANLSLTKLIRGLNFQNFQNANRNT